LFRGITRKSARIRSAPGGAGNTLRGLTHQPDAAGRGLAMQATRNPFKSEARPEDRHRRPRTPLIIPDRVAERAATAYDEEPESGCWISTYSTGSHGYAQIGWQERPKVPHRRATTAHRAAWVYWTGAQIPVGMTIDHKCKNRRCVNPDH